MPYVLNHVGIGVVKAMVCTRHCTSPFTFETNGDVDDNDDNDTIADKPHSNAKAHTLTANDWIKGQDADPTISIVKTCVSLGTCPNQNQLHEYPLEARKYLRNWKRLILEDRVLHHRSCIRGKSVYTTIWVTKEGIGLSVLLRSVLLAWYGC